MSAISPQDRSVRVSTVWWRRYGDIHCTVVSQPHLSHNSGSLLSTTLQKPVFDEKAERERLPTLKMRELRMARELGASDDDIETVLNSDEQSSAFIELLLLLLQAAS